MRNSGKQSGFSAVELLITLFVAAAFLISGYQLYTFAVKDGGSSRMQANASREADNYLQKYKPTATDPCTSSTPLNGAATISGLSAVNVRVDIECPYASNTAISRIKVTLTYGTPQQTVVSSTLIKPACPKGFIPVPGSKTYGTQDFCVMKYEAQQNGTQPVSLPSGSPWFTSQIDAMDYSKNACSGCHLITEAEWLTIAENILGTPQSWRVGAIGTYWVAEGHSKSNPGTALPVGPDDSDPYYQITDTCPGGCGFGSDQNRILYLSNGQAIWDFSGNAWEWTSGQTVGRQPGGASAAWRDWNTIAGTGSLSPNPFPSYTNVPNASSWGHCQGIGEVFSSTTDNALRGFMRGGGASDYNIDISCPYGTSGVSGIFALILNQTPKFDNGTVGFRVAR